MEQRSTGRPPKHKKTWEASCYASLRRMYFIKWGKKLLQIAFIGAILFALVQGILFTYDRYVVFNNSFIVQKVIVKTNGHMTQKDVYKALDLTPETNILFLKTKDLEELIKRHPHIADASITKELPNTLLVDIKERIPLAWIDCPLCHVYGRDAQNGFFIDITGHIFPYDESIHKRFEQVPSLKIPLPNKKTLEAGDNVLNTQLKQVLKFIERLPVYSTRGLPQIIDLDILNEWSFSAHFITGLNATFYLYNPDIQLDHLVLLLEHTRSQNQRLVLANLVSIKNISVRLEPGNEEDHLEPLPTLIHGENTSLASNNTDSASDLSAPQDNSILNANNIIVAQPEISTPMAAPPTPNRPITITPTDINIPTPQNDIIPDSKTTHKGPLLPQENSKDSTLTKETPLPSESKANNGLENKTDNSNTKVASSTHTTKTEAPTQPSSEKSLTTSNKKEKSSSEKKSSENLPSQKKSSTSSKTTKSSRSSNSSKKSASSSKSSSKNTKSSTSHSSNSSSKSTPTAPHPTQQKPVEIPSFNW